MYNLNYQKNLNCDTATASVVVSCYNQEKYIEDCLESILNQEVNFNLEIIVCDDASTDSTADIIRRVASEHEGLFNLQLSTDNLGAAGNYLKGHALATGDIVFHFDGDDIMLPGKLQTQFDLFSDSSVNLVFHRARYFNDANTTSLLTGSISSEKTPVYFSCRELACWGTIAVHSSYAYRRTSRKITSLNREFMEWFFAMDSLYYGGKGVYIDDVLTGYRCNEDGIAYSRSRKGRIKAYKIYTTDLLEYFDRGLFRSELYANGVASFMGMVRYNYYFDRQLIYFLLKRFRFFKLRLVIEAIRTRRTVSHRE